jgi:hypothetical protein
MAGNAVKYTPEIIQRTCAKCGSGPGAYCRGPFSGGKMLPPHSVRVRGLVTMPDNKLFTREALSIRCSLCDAKPGERCVTVSRTIRTIKGTGRGPTKPHSVRVKEAEEQYTRALKSKDEAEESGK